MNPQPSPACIEVKKVDLSLLLEVTLKINLMLRLRQEESLSLKAPESSHVKLSQAVVLLLDTSTTRESETKKDYTLIIGQASLSVISDITGIVKLATAR